MINKTDFLNLHSGGKKMIMILIFTIFFSLFANLTHADPIINNVSGSVNHNSSISLSGANFGSKSPAAPCLWDNGENDTHGGNVSINYPDAVRSFYDTIAMVWPHSGCADDYELNYRRHPFTNPYSGARPIPGPHDRSNNYLAAGAWGPEPVNYARDIAVGYYRGATGSPKWYAIWYVRHDENTWPTGCGGSGCNNVKVWDLENGDDYLGSSGHLYCACNGASCYADHSNSQCLGMNAIICGDNDCTNWTKSELGNWIHDEVVFRNNPAKLLETKFDNQSAGTKQFDKNCSGPMLGWDPKAFFVGGFNRYFDYGNGYTHGGMWRYFDDIYIDDTWSRVMLANNSNYANATILEPQIPSAWSHSSITVKVNLGALTGSTAYLFVFDSNNNRNSTGYPVTIGGGGGTTTTTIAADTTPPNPPTGLTIVTTTIP